MVAKRELQSLSTEELESFIQKTDREMQSLRDDKRRAHELLDEKNAQADAIRRYEQMSEPERAALLQHMEAVGIESQEQVSEVG